MNAALSPLQLAQTLAPTFAQRAVLHDADGSFPHVNFQDLAAAGLLSLAASPSLLADADAPKETNAGVPPANGVGLGQLSAIVGAVGEACPATALVLCMQYLQHRTLSRADSRWPRHVAQRVVRSANSEVALINALRGEPELGSPTRGGLPATTATRTAEGWRFNGRKIYCTGGPGLRWLSVWARTDEATPRVGTFLVDAQLAGVRLEESWNHFGQRATGSHDIVFDNVLLPADSAVDIRLPHEWTPAGQAQMQAEMAVYLGALYTGAAKAARRWLIEFLQTRQPSNLGAALATLPRMQEAVGRIERLIYVNTALMRDHVRRVEGGELPSPTESGLLKVQLTESAVAAVQEALALSGNHGLNRRNPLERHLRDVLCGPVHAPQVDAVLVQAGKQALGV